MDLRSFSFLLLATAVLGSSSPTENEVHGQIEAIPLDVMEDTKLDVVGLLLKYGYPSETHTVQTEDGYILTMHRIPRGKGTRGQQKAAKPVVFLMHGILSSSADWITAGPHTALGYQLADEGFDVWMGNARGNKYSRNHVSLKPSSSKFWKFSWNEIGYYDLPAMINTVLAKTGQGKLHYIGHSQGTTSFFVMASLRPEFNMKIKSMQALAPVAYMSNLKSPLVKALAPFANTLELLTSLIGVNEFFPSSQIMTIATNLLCKEGSVFQPVCSNFLFLLCGFSPDLLNTTMLPVYMAHTPAGSSSMQMVHYGQLYQSAKFRKYDHGLLGNMGEYGSISPPNYQLEKVTAPVALHYAYNDWMAHPIDVFQLWSQLPNPIELIPVKHQTFNHLDFMWAINVRELLYNKVIQIMRQYN